MRANRSRFITIATILLVIAGLAGTLTAVLRSAHGPSESGGGRVDGRAGGVDLERVVADYTSRFGPGHGYRQPRKADREGVAEAVGLLLDGHRDQAQQRLSQLDFTLRTLVDRVSGRSFAEIADRSDDAVAPRGWGRVYVDLGHRARWSVQVPHPVADQGTERLGVGVLRGSPGGVLVIAGAHRKAGRGDSADVAHRQDTVFDAVCDELARRGLPGIQVHGFADDSAPGYDVIASTGKGTTGRADGRRLADALRRKGFDVCRAWARSCPLEGTENVQGRRADSEGLAFLHVEFAHAVRDDEARMARAVTAVNTITARWAAAG
ncbi:hypothetical protein [Streptomyces anandii]|uniref:hypothetical protein n=1 Tax=Streptomyces anandii TaxID=285454 RepID=UPI0016757C78|nr:hypothetical protein [Streptomyces anandii]GGX81781.1 hypothetical protein GCM10010510_28530 [Streptomyces anandii JCM 4720]